MAEPETLTPPAAAETPAPPPGRPLVAMIPRGLGGVGDAAAQQRRVNALIGPALGATKCWYNGDGPLLAFPNTAPAGAPPTPATIERDHARASLLFPKDHPRHPEERYAWYFGSPRADGTWWPTGERAEGFGDRPERVKFGFERADG